MFFETITQIQTDQQNYDKTIYLTLDSDWASDFILDHVLELLEDKNIKTTWMITHDSQTLNALKKSQRIELGIHPNFNDMLLTSSSKKASIEERLKELLDITDGARVVRSHSMTQSSRLLDIFHSFNITHDCNHYIPYSSGIILRPWKLLNGMARIPFGWEDDLDFQNMNTNFINRILDSPGIKVFNFHPIHIFLNSSSMINYETSREWHGDFRRLKRFVNKSYGTKNFLLDLIELASERD